MTSLISPAFSQMIAQMYGEPGRQWIADLPAVLDAYAQRWSLTLLPPFELSFNYVAPVRRADGSPAVIKLGFPDPELLSEMHALQAYAGRGIVRILEVDLEHQVMLLERLQPGETLLSLGDDERMTRVAAEVMIQLWCPAPEARPLLTVESWTAGLQRLRPYFNGTTGPFPEALVSMAEGIFAEFVPSQGERVLLHGDLHHWNILSAQRSPWLAIDPKGVIGEQEYEVGAFLRNPDLAPYDLPTLVQLQDRRLAILQEMLGFDRQRMLGWALAQAVLSAWWAMDDYGDFWQQAIFCAQALQRLMT